MTTRYAIAAARLLLALPFALVALVPVRAQAAERRCGYVENPTPGNWWLTDGRGQWIMGTQGREPAEGMETIPQSFYEFGWVRTNGYYGYRCGCLTVDTDRTGLRITRVRAAQALPMKRCTADPALRGKRPPP
jgi:hypothetical protein